ncbi:hypothetical protein HET69_31795 [Streptomyces sp. CJ_13]|uniref:MazG-like family protein n=1 Tax=Streptomyces sp. CJ_13 TaxID=2724943 RepID=UPI001BDD471A|nr:MazG-like family protein [Streptomyces sp. CJ_13]MBT1188436.1 hypothetical protein [Streptomyces sp. CJ_13]
MDASTWDNIGRLKSWLDDEGGKRSETETRLLRVLKIVEEVGKVAEAVRGAVGGNPRKGASHTWDDVQKELADVIVTAMVALETVTPEAERVLGYRLQHLVDRVLEPQK